MENGLIINGRYEIKNPKMALIGEGGMGTVYQAVDLRTGLPVAVKHLKPELVANDPHQVERFAREGEALRQLDHPNIVKVLATAEENNQHYIIMEYVEGGSLRELMDRNRQLPLEQVINIGLELADALTRAHHLHIIHRDIKPANVLIAQDGTPRLTDFGIAHIGDQSRITQAGTLTGTYAYLSPEACNGLELDGRADIWSFGILLYEMLAGEHPFEKNHLAATLHSIMNNNASDLTLFRVDLPPHLAHLIQQMMIKNRDNRIGSARLVGAELEAIQQGVDTPSDLVSGFRSRFATPTPASAPRPRHNLPNQPTSFIGRASELANIAERLANSACQLLSLIGPGGIGKTRLAVQAAEAEIPNFANGVYFVALAPLSSPDSLVPTLAEAISFSFYRTNDPDDLGPSPRQQLLDYLHEKQMLLVMDNFEHLLDGANLLDDILTNAPNLKILVTSRERLNLRGEWVLQIGGMPFPAEAEPDVRGTGAKGYSAVQLFLNHAQRIDSSFNLDEQNESAVIRLCRLVDGMPLGIELAAAWVQMLTPNEIIKEIETNFDFLETTMRNVPERHRSIRAVFEYSWNLLQPEERQFMGKLSVFRGGFTREAAGFIAMNGRPVATLPLLSSLVGKSLLQRAADGRYQLHELLRQYSAEKLTAPAEGDDKEIVKFKASEAHSRYYLNRLVEREQDLTNRKQRPALDELETEIENIREAWRWAIINCREEAITNAQQGLANFYWAENWLEEGAELFAQAAQTFSQNQVENRLLIAKLRTQESGYRLITGEVERALNCFNETLAEFRELKSELDEANVLSWIGGAKARAGHLDEAKTYQTQSLEIYRRLGDKNGIAATLFQLGFIANEQGHYEKSIELQSEALRLRRETGNLAAIIGILSNLGFVAYRKGDLDTARSYAREALAINQILNNQAGISTAIRQLGMVAGLEGNYQQAHDNYLETLHMNRELGNPNAIANSYINLSHISYKMGNYEDSENYARELLVIADKLNNRWTMLYCRNNLGMAVLKLGRHQEAREHLLTALKIAKGMRAVPVSLESLTGMVQVLFEEGDQALAMEICSFILNHPALIHDTRELIRPIYDQYAAEVDEEVLKTAEALAKERDAAWYWDKLLGTS